MDYGYDVDRVGKFDMLKWALTGESQRVAVFDPDLIEDCPDKDTPYNPYRDPDEVKELFLIRCKAMTRSKLDHKYHALTVTVNPKLWKGKYDNSQRHVLDVILRMNSKEFMMIPAVSENNYLHWHGVVRCDSRAQYVKLEKKLHMALGFTATRQIKGDGTEWYNYVFDPHQRQHELKPWVSLSALTMGRRQT